MKLAQIVPRILALLLSISFSLPSGVYPELNQSALRPLETAQREAGLEELRRNLGGSAGLEEEEDTLKRYIKYVLEQDKQQVRSHISLSLEDLGTGKTTKYFLPLKDLDQLGGIDLLLGNPQEEANSAVLKIFPPRPGRTLPTIQYQDQISEITKDLLILGRNPEKSVQKPGEDRKISYFKIKGKSLVSSVHVAMSLKGLDMTIQDLNSTNGTFFVTGDAERISSLRAWAQPSDNSAVAVPQKSSKQPATHIPPAQEDVDTTLTTLTQSNHAKNGGKSLFGLFRKRPIPREVIVAMLKDIEDWFPTMPVNPEFVKSNGDPDPGKLAGDVLGVMQGLLSQPNQESEVIERIFVVLQRIDKAKVVTDPTVWDPVITALLNEVERLLGQPNQEISVLLHVVYILVWVDQAKMASKERLIPLGTSLIEQIRRFLSQSDRDPKTIFSALGVLKAINKANIATDDAWVPVAEPLVVAGLSDFYAVVRRSSKELLKSFIERNRRGAVFSADAALIKTMSALADTTADPQRRDSLLLFAIQYVQDSLPVIMSDEGEKQVGQQQREELLAGAINPGVKILKNSEANSQVQKAVLKIFLPLAEQEIPGLERAWEDLKRIAVDSFGTVAGSYALATMVTLPRATNLLAPDGDMIDLLARRIQSTVAAIRSEDEEIQGLARKTAFRLLIKLIDLPPDLPSGSRNELLQARNELLLRLLITLHETPHLVIKSFQKLPLVTWFGAEAYNHLMTMAIRKTGVDRIKGNLLSAESSPEATPSITFVLSPEALKAVGLASLGKDPLVVVQDKRLLMPWDLFLTLVSEGEEKGIPSEAVVKMLELFQKGMLELGVHNVSTNQAEFISGPEFLTGGKRFESQKLILTLEQLSNPTGAVSPASPQTGLEEADEAELQFLQPLPSRFKEIPIVIDPSNQMDLAFFFLNIQSQKVGLILKTELEEHNGQHRLFLDT